MPNLRKERKGVAASPLIAIYAAKKVATASNDTKFSEFACNTCDSHLIVNASEDSKPYCVLCSGDMVFVKDPNEEVVKLTDGDTMASLECTSCNTHLMLEQSQVAEFNGEIACPICGTQHSFTDENDEDKEDSDDGQDETGAMDENEDAEDAEDAEEEDNDPEDDAEAGVDEDDEDEDDLESDTADGSTKAAATAAKGNSVKTPAKPPVKVPAKKGKKAKATVGDDADDDNGADEDNLPDQEDEDGDALDGQEYVENQGGENGVGASIVKLLDLAAVSGDKETVIRFTNNGAAIIASVNDISVAAQYKDDLPESNRGLFNDQAYLTALTNSVNTAGLEQTIADFGFRPLTVSIRSKALAQLAQERVTAAAQELAADESHKLAVEIKACMAIASTGITKSFWSGSKHPIRDALVSELASAGVSQPSRIVNRALAKSNDLYNKEVIEKAFELMEKPVEVRNSLAHAISEMAFPTRITSAEEDASTDDTGEQGTEGASVTTRLGRPFSQSSTAVSRESASARKDSVARTVADMRSRFGRMFPRN